MIIKEILINVDCFLLTCKYKYANLNNDKGSALQTPALIYGGIHNEKLRLL